METYRDPSAPVAERVEDLLGRMTLEEKVAQLCGNLPFSVVRGGRASRELLKKSFPDGLGRITQYSTVGIAHPEEIARITNDIQSYFVEETRLGIPVALQSENLCGYPGRGGTLFPSQTNVGATWEPELAEKMSAAIGRESRAVGITSAMSPVIDVSRDPRWGRTYETYGEDPYLVSQMGISYVRGMQGDHEHGVACIGKHFLGYAETQGGLNCAALRMGDRELYETFATPFEAAMKEADLSSVMANYGEIDGLCVCANPKISKTLLRDTMGFKGQLTSDGAGIMRMWNFYHIAKSHAEAGLIAKRAGVDTEIPVGAGFAYLPEYVRAGKLSEEEIDASVRRILTIKFAYGLFEHPYAETEAVSTSMGGKRAQELSSRIAHDSLVLLKNDGILPLRRQKKLAVIGPHAQSLRYPVSGYTYPAYIEMMDSMREGVAGAGSFGGMADEEAKAKKSGNVFATLADCLSEEDLASLPSMEETLRSMGATTLAEELAKDFDVTAVQGCTIKGEDASGIAEAIAAAEEADAAVLALGGNCGWFDVTGGEGKDRSTLELPGVQEQLLEAVTATGKPVIVVLYGPGIFSVSWAERHVAAILQAWMPGQHAARAVADVLLGRTNPGGKLPVTIPRRVGQVPMYYNHKTGSGYADGADGTASNIFSGGYVDCPNSPLFPFGFGLSYTSFRLEELEIAESRVPCTGTIHVGVMVSNTGSLAGDEVVQLYTHFLDAHVTRPNKQLSGFRRVHLEAGESRHISFDLDAAQLGYYNEDMVFSVEPGRLDIMVGTSSADLPLCAQVELTGEPCELLWHRSYTCNVTVQ